jgi:hypothetical protein
VAGLCEHGEEDAVSLEGKEFLYYLNDCYFVKENSAP